MNEKKVEASALQPIKIETPVEEISYKRVRRGAIIKNFKPFQGRIYNYREAGKYLILSIRQSKLPGYAGERKNIPRFINRFVRLEKIGTKESMAIRKRVMQITPNSIETPSELLEPNSLETI